MEGVSVSIKTINIFEKAYDKEKDKIINIILEKIMNILKINNYIFLY